MSLLERAEAAHVNAFNGASDDAAAAANFEKIYQSMEAPPGQPPVASPGQQEPPAPSEQQPPEQIPLDAQPAEVSPEDPEYQDLQDYFARSQVDFESVLAMPVAVKGGHATLKDLIAAHEGTAEHTQRAQAFAEQQQKWEAERTQYQQVLQQNLAFAQQLAQIAHQQLQGEYGQVDWARLAREDPATYNQHRPLFDERTRQLQQAFSQIQAAQQQQFYQQQQQREARRAPEWQKFLAAYPSLRDQKALDAATQQAHAYAKQIGLSADEIAQIDYDSRFMRIIYDASRVAKTQTNVTQALRKVRAAPQMSNPGARVVRDPQTAQRANLKKLAFSKEGRRNPDIQAAYFDTLA